VPRLPARRAGGIRTAVLDEGDDAVPVGLPEAIGVVDEGVRPPLSEVGRHRESGRRLARQCGLTRPDEPGEEGQRRRQPG